MKLQKKDSLHTSNFHQYDSTLMNLTSSRGEWENPSPQTLHPGSI